MSLVGSLKCLVLTHSPDEDLRHTFCAEDTEMTFCERCGALMKDVDGEWVVAQ